MGDPHSSEAQSLVIPCQKWLIWNAPTPRRALGGVVSVSLIEGGPPPPAGEFIQTFFSLHGHSFLRVRRKGTTETSGRGRVW